MEQYGTEAFTFHLRTVSEQSERSTLPSVNGVIVLFLPPYSPDLNPIESAFSCVKYYLKEHDELLQTIPDPFPVMYSSFQDTITAEKCKKLDKRLWLLNSIKLCSIN